MLHRHLLGRWGFGLIIQRTPADREQFSLNDQRESVYVALD
jgi:hypothetical protein